MNSRLAHLQPYPFQRLAQLFEGTTPPADKSPIRLSIGEPKHAAPQMVIDSLKGSLENISHYPLTRGQDDLREAMAAWANRRFQLDNQPVDPNRHILPVAGTREALFSIAQAIIDTDNQGSNGKPVIICPNPFYQIYEGAAILAGAEPWFINTTAETGYKMDFSQVPGSIWARTQMVYVCSPGNPTGAVMNRGEFSALIDLAEQHDFIIVSDECYSEIYFDEATPPVGLLQVAAERNIKDFRRCLAFHSLSKRSNLPGLRSGFVAGDGELLKAYLQYRTYHGSTLSPPVQTASCLAWNDEQHVRDNRQAYRAKFDAVLEILEPVLDVSRPDAGFYLWPRTPVSDTEFARGLWNSEHVMVLPGQFLSRDTGTGNPGANHVRLALVATLEECIEAAKRIRRFTESLI
ncbi:MAG: succinyldiaminopimelate transaminase [Gammaproteobacteria bacterium]|nr:succinyldiaminopimelate transaminase [Gammaproteobacteria bacterium]